MNSEFNNKIVIITGGASGIGLAMVKAFSEAGPVAVELPCYSAGRPGKGAKGPDRRRCP